MLRSEHVHSPRLTAIALATLMGLCACGGGGDGATAPAAPVTPAGLSGSVAVGAPITNGKLRVLDANGAVVATDVSIDANGRYADVALTGPAPYRIEACGYAGPNYLCVYSVASAAGTANVTPLTTATVLLAAGAAPDALMSGSAPALTAATVSTAQTQLRNSLSSVISSAGVSGSFDFVSGALDAGSRTGYDGLLDAVGVKFGEDTQPFVQITPRLGSGNLYLEQGVSSGTVTAAAGASGLQLGGIETLFENMSKAVASPAACANASTGMQAAMATDAQLSFDGPVPMQGAAAVAETLCSLFAGDDEMEPMWGATFMSPTLGKCDLSGAAPLCGVSFVLQLPGGDVLPVGNGMAATQEAGVWKFRGDLAPIGLSASARAQRTQRIDTTGAPLDYARAFAFDVAAAPGVACARVSQRDANGNSVPLAYYKRHAPTPDQTNLSLWTVDGFGQSASLNPLAGFTRSGDDTWLALPTGTAGDAVIRNFYRGGRSVVVSLYADAACATPHVIAGKSEFDVEVEGVPPLWAAMENLPWPELEATTRTALSALTIDAGATGSLSVAWNFARGPLGLREATVCGSQAACGDGGTGRLANKGLRASSRSATIDLNNSGAALGTDSEKMLALNGRNGEGVAVQSNYLACPAVAAGQACR